jgi:hypothetical protein
MKPIGYELTPLQRQWNKWLSFPVDRNLLATPPDCLAALVHASTPDLDYPVQLSNQWIRESDHTAARRTQHTGTYLFLAAPRPARPDDCVRRTPLATYRKRHGLVEGQPKLETGEVGQRSELIKQMKKHLVHPRRCAVLDDNGVERDGSNSCRPRKSKAKKKKKKKRAASASSFRFNGAAAEFTPARGSSASASHDHSRGESVQGASSPGTEDDAAATDAVEPPCTVADGAAAATSDGEVEKAGDGVEPHLQLCSARFV